MEESIELLHRQVLLEVNVVTLLQHFWVQLVAGVVVVEDYIVSIIRSLVLEGSINVGDHELVLILLFIPAFVHEAFLGHQGFMKRVFVLLRVEEEVKGEVVFVLQVTSENVVFSSQNVHVFDNFIKFSLMLSQSVALESLFVNGWELDLTRVLLEDFLFEALKRKGANHFIQLGLQIGLQLLDFLLDEGLQILLDSLANFVCLETEDEISEMGVQHGLLWIERKDLESDTVALGKNEVAQLGKNLRGRL